MSPAAPSPVREQLSIELDELQGLMQQAKAEREASRRHKAAGRVSDFFLRRQKHDLWFGLLSVLLCLREVHGSTLFKLSEEAFSLSQAHMELSLYFRQWTNAGTLYKVVNILGDHWRASLEIGAATSFSSMYTAGSSQPAVNRAGSGSGSGSGVFATPAAAVVVGDHSMQAACGSGGVLVGRSSRISQVEMMEDGAGEVYLE